MKANNLVPDEVENFIILKLWTYELVYPSLTHRGATFYFIIEYNSLIWLFFIDICLSVYFTYMVVTLSVFYLKNTAN